MKKYRCARCGAKIAKEEVKGGRVRCGVCGCVGAVNAAGIVVTLYEGEDGEIDDVTVLGNKYTLDKHPSAYKIEGTKLVGFRSRFAKDIEVPYGVTEIASGVFAGTKITRRFAVHA